jgi:hypothetical protein
MTSKKRFLGVFAAALVALSGFAVTVAAQPAAASCSLVTVGHPDSLTIGGQTAATLKQVYCDATRTTYAQLDINQAWYNAGHRGWNVVLYIVMACDDCHYEVASNTWTNSSLTQFIGAHQAIDDSYVLPSKPWEAYADFKYNSCTRELRTDVHDYHDGSNSGSVLSVVPC